jgi:hypothetical protein
MPCAGCLRIRAALKNGIRVVARPVLVIRKPQPKPQPVERRVHPSAKK